MTIRQLFFTLTFATTFISCDNFNNNVKEQIDSSVKDAKKNMTSDLTNAKKTFTETYNKVLLHSNDSIFTNKITNVYFSINETSRYIDSLKTKINKLDDEDFNNINLIKKIFLYDGIGDSLFNKVKLSYTFAEDISLSDTTKSRIKRVRDTYTSETKKQFFGLNSPLGVDMILYGIESELIKNGTISLREIINK